MSSSTCLREFMGGVSAIMPKELDFTSTTVGEWEDEPDEPDEPVDLDTMHCTESTLGKVSLPPKACFVLGKVVQVQFDGRFLGMDTP